VGSPDRAVTDAGRQGVTLARLAADGSLSVVLRDVRRRWPVAAAVTLATLGGGTLYAESLPSSYASSAIVAFSPKPDTNAAADTVRIVLPKYVAYATARPTLNIVAEASGERPGALSDAVDASIATDSGNLSLSVELRSPERAARAANALTNAVVDFAAEDDLLDATVVARALPSTSPSGPPRRLFEAAALLVGALAGVGAAVALERGRPRIRTWRDVGLVTGYQVLGRVPSSRRFRDRPDDAMADPVVGTAMRTLRTNLEQMSRERPTHVLAVTSSVPGEGKTTIASALAVTLARLNASVLLVDGDLRRPRLHHLFGIDPTPGFANVLRGRSELKDALRAGPVKGLTLLPTADDADAGDLLARNLAGVLREARHQFDVIIIDSPPVLVGDDARTVSVLSEGVLFVTSSDTHANAVAEAAAALDSLGVTVLGAVANRMRERKSSEYAYGSYAAART